MWQRLIDILGKICAAYDSLAKLGERKRNALVVVDMESLAKILDEEQLLAARIQNLEKQRGSVLKELAKTNPTINQSTKAEDFYQKAPSLAIEKRLISLHKTLTKNVDRALKIRDNNQILAQGALDAVKFHLNRLSGATVQPTYGNRGGDVVTHKKNFDFKA